MPAVRAVGLNTLRRMTSRAAHKEKPVPGIRPVRMPPDLREEAAAETAPTPRSDASAAFRAIRLRLTRQLAVGMANEVGIGRIKLIDDQRPVGQDRLVLSRHQGGVELLQDHAV